MVVWAGALLASVGLRSGSALGDVEVRRVVSLAPSVTEILFALGVGDRVVGVSAYCDYPPEAQRIDRIGTFLTPNVERILAKQPDLVIGVPSPGNRAPVENLRSLGLRVVIVDPEGVAAILESIRSIAAAVGVPEEGERLVGAIGRRLAALAGRLEGAARRRVLMVVGRAPLMAAGRGTYQDELIRLAGGDNVAAASGEHWPNLGVEFVIAAAPEVIIDVSMGSEATSADGAMAFWRAFPTVPAVRDRRVHTEGASALLRPGPRVAETLELVARYVHPERFATGGDGAAAP